MNIFSNNRKSRMSALTVLLSAVLFFHTALLPVLAEDPEDGQPAEPDIEQIEEQPAGQDTDGTGGETDEEITEESDEQTGEETEDPADEQNTDETGEETDASLLRAAEGKTYKRTILMYVCGTDLETDAGMATYNLRQILKSSFSEDDDVKYIIMTGGTNLWHLEKDNLVFPDDVYVPADAVAVMDDPSYPSEYYYDDDPTSAISNVYNQIWEAKGIDAAENPGKLVLVDGDGVLGDGESAKRSLIRSEDNDIDGYGGFNYDKADDYEWMNDPDVLKAFIDYGVDNYPAEKYDLILWDHGGGPVGGFCNNQQEPRHGFYSSMTVAELADAFKNNKVVDTDSDGKPDSKFDFIDFDACLMSGVEDLLVFSDYMDYYIASPETEPGYGQYYGPEEGQYTGWLDALGKNTDIDTFELGKIIVDDFVKFYDKESGDGSSQEGTLGIFDVEKVVTPDFIEALSLIDVMLCLELRGGSYYDEFRSYKNAIAYANEQYHDLGNLLTYLAFEYDDLDYQDFKDGNPNISSSYTELAMDILKVICNEEIVYARSTKGIHTPETYYFDDCGESSYDVLDCHELQYGQQPTSGLYLCFDPLEDPKDFFPNYHLYMNELIGQMDPDDPRTEYFRNHLKTFELYGIVFYTGRAVTDMITNEDINPEDIDYDKVKDYWADHKDVTNFTMLDELMETLFECVGGKDEVEGWLIGLINQMRVEAIQEDKAEAEKTDNGYRITLNEVRKQAVDNVQMEVFAELPALKEFLEDPAHAVYVERFKDKSPSVAIGTVIGAEVFDVDPEDYEQALDWLYDPTSTWTIDKPETKWYALRDAEGKLHVTAAECDEKEIDIPTAYMTMEPEPVWSEDYSEIIGYELKESWHLVYLIYLKDADGNIDLYGFAFESGGGYRIVEAKDYNGDYELYTAMEFGPWGQMVPISYEPFRLTAETVNSLKLEYMELDEIGRDVADIDGDGKAAHYTVTATNIYGIKTDITDRLLEDEEVVFDPYVIQGDGQVWTKGSGTVASFTFKSEENDDETFERFIGIQIDGKDVDPQNYTAAAGSVIIDLKPEYLETLSEGKHTLKALFDGGEAEASFEIVKKPDDTPEPDNPDSDNTPEPENPDSDSTPDPDIPDGDNIPAPDTPDSDITPEPDTPDSDITPEPENSGRNNTPVPDTSDRNNTGMWSCILVMSLATAAGCIFLRRRFISE